MMRLFGILAGSAIGAAILVAVVGIPRLAGPDRAAAIVGPLPAPAATDPAPVVAEEPLPPAPAAAVAEAPGPTAPVQAESPAHEPAAAEIATPVAAAHVPVEASSMPVEPAPLRWHAFWSPFRSRVAANGFVAELSRVTGLDYRVVAVKPGVYEVAFGYEDDAEIDAKLATIRAATGLEMPGS